MVKQINAGSELSWLFSVLAMIIYAPFLVNIIVVQQPEFGWIHFTFFFASAVLHVVYILLLQHGYRVGKLSVVYPTARATGPLLSTMVAILILGEAVTGQIIIGGLAIIIAVLPLTNGGKKSNKHLAISLGFGVAVGITIASYTIVDAYSVANLLIPPLIIDYAFSVGAVVFLAPAVYRRKFEVRRLWMEHRWSVIAIACLSPLAYILVPYALKFTPVVYVAPAREISVLITVLMGVFLLKEGKLKPKLGWALLILAGLGLLVTG